MTHNSISIQLLQFLHLLWSNRIPPKLSAQQESHFNSFKSSKGKGVSVSTYNGVILRNLQLLGTLGHSCRIF